MQQQLFLFTESKEDILERKINDLKESHDKVRKSSFAKYTELLHLYKELSNEVGLLKKSMCH